MPSAPYRNASRNATRSTSRSAAWKHREDSIEIAVDERPVVALLPDDRRVRVGLVMPAVDHVVEVSLQPTSAATALEDAARRAQTPMSAVGASARRALTDAATRSNAWQPTAEMCLHRALGGVAFPLLAAAYDSGAQPLLEVPRWAAPVLAATTVRDGAAAAFGAKASKPVRRALVEAIRPLQGGEMDPTVLGLALMGREVLEPDRLARVLRAQRVLHPAAHLPDTMRLGRACAVVSGWGSERAERVLIEAAGRTDGMALLNDTIRYARHLGDHGPTPPLPNRLGELHEVHRALMRSLPERATPAAEPAPRRRRAAPAPRRPRTRAEPPAHAEPPAPAHRLFAPPTRGGPVGADTPITASADVRALELAEMGQLAFVLPRTVGDIHRWGALMSNCLADFAPAAAAGRSILIGVLRANRLAYVIELTPGGSIRQFCGPANRRPDRRDRRTVVAAMAAAGVLDTHAQSNREWLAEVDVGLL